MREIHDCYYKDYDNMNDKVMAGDTWGIPNDKRTHVLISSVSGKHITYQYKTRPYTGGLVLKNLWHELGWSLISREQQQKE